MKTITGTLVFVIKDGKVLLAQKKTAENIDAVEAIGKLNGYGGISKLNEASEDCLMREFSEETSGAKLIKPLLIKVGEITFTRMPVSKFYCHIYTTEKYSGDIKSSNEMVNPSWYKISSLTYEDDFIETDRFWLPRILSGQKLKGELWFDNNKRLLCYELNQVESF